MEGFEPLIFRLRADTLIDFEVVIDPPNNELNQLLLRLLESVELVLQRIQHLL